MKEPARIERNRQRLTECFGPFAIVVRKVLDDLEAQGFRARIQDAWRSKEDQLKAFNAGTSKTKFGFHNTTGAGDAKEALARDVLDDNNPLNPPTRYLLALGRAARARGVTTGVTWDLPPALLAGVEAAMASGSIDTPVKVGWDPTHIEPVGITITAAKGGSRPTFNNGGAPAPAPVLGGGQPQIHVVQRGETLSKIARDNGITLARLLELNPQFLFNPNLIHVGDEVRVV